MHGYCKVLAANSVILSCFLASSFEFRIIVFRYLAVFDQFTIFCARAIIMCPKNFIAAETSRAQINPGNVRASTAKVFRNGFRHPHGKPLSFFLINCEAKCGALSAAFISQLLIPMSRPITKKIFFLPVMLNKSIVGHFWIEIDRRITPTVFVCCTLSRAVPWWWRSGVDIHLFPSNFMYGIAGIHNHTRVLQGLKQT